MHIQIPYKNWTCIGVFWFTTVVKIPKKKIVAFGFVAFVINPFKNADFFEVKSLLLIVISESFTLDFSFKITFN